MASKRSRTGCLTCRQRKLKCSEEKPTCKQCQKANRPCVPSSGITFRHQQNPSMNGGADGDGSLKSFYGYKETFGKSTTWVDIPRDLTFIHTSNPYEDEDVDDSNIDAQFARRLLEQSQSDHPFTISQAAYPAYATHGLEALSAVASDQYSYAPPSTAPMNSVEQSSLATTVPSMSPQNSTSTPNNHLDFILNPSSGLPTGEVNIDPRLNSQTPSIPSQALQSPIFQVCNNPFNATPGGKVRSRSFKGFRRRSALDDPYLTFLLRDYSERAGTWMDLFDLDRWFGAKVPVLAVSCPLLLYSCASLSAKSLARVEGRKPVMGGQVSPHRRSKMEYWPDQQPLDAEGWIRKGREYYNIAVSVLRQALAGATRPPTSALPPESTLETLTLVQGSPLPTTSSDETFAAIAILCNYEFLDASGPEWSQHLDGAKTLFDIAQDRMNYLTLPPSPVSIAQQVAQQLDPGITISGVSQGRRAVFWNFARQDMLSAFINETRTRLDPDDLPTWRSVGLKLTPEGFVLPSKPHGLGLYSELPMGDDMISNALVWLVMKIVNFMATAVAESPTSSGYNIHQKERLQYWKSLELQLHKWYEGLPDGFHPTAVHVRDPEIGIEEEFFPRPMCASTMEWYHFARIQLLHNKPQIAPAASASRSNSTLGSLASHASSAAIWQQLREHAKEIVAIGLGRSDEGTRIHAVQPLWAAGQVLGIDDDEPDEETEISRDVREWRRVIVELLRSIERDMGWASEYRVQNLLRFWGDPSADPTTDTLGTEIMVE